VVYSPRMDNPIQVEPQPRIDTLVIDAVTGEQRRRTEYTGTVWFGPRPQATRFGVVTHTRAANIGSPFYLPDSLPYRADTAMEALVVCTVALRAAAEEIHHILDTRAGLVTDARNPAVAWLQVQVVANGYIPIAVSYRVDVLVAPDAILGSGPEAGGTGTP
jgi:hypothetical protein